MEPLDHFSHGLSWIKTPLETLGIHIMNNQEENINNNFKPKLATSKNVLNMWKQRTRSIKGNITIDNSLAVSSLNHHIQFRPIQKHMTLFKMLYGKQNLHKLHKTLGKANADKGQNLNYANKC